MTKWEIVQATEDDIQLPQYLEQGFEPFAVVTVPFIGTVIFLKREVEYAG